VSRGEDVAPRVPAVAHLALVAVQLMFASLSVAGKLAMRDLPPRGVIAVRAPAALVLLFAIRLVHRPWERVAPVDIGRLALYSLFGITLNMLLFIEGLGRSTATNAVILNATIPVFTFCWALLLGRERATAMRLLGILVALGGALTLVGLDGFKGGSEAALGNLCLVGNSISFALYLVLSRPLFARYRTSTAITWIFLFGSLGILPFALPSLVPHLSEVTPRGWAALAYIVLFPTVGTYFLNGFALRRAPSSLVAVYIYLQPLIGALLASALLGEQPSASALAGGLLIALGIALVSRGGPVRRAPTA
jgi:drug/metabolite transporter (DMT)-like permease